MLLLSLLLRLLPLLRLLLPRPRVLRQLRRLQSSHSKRGDRVVLRFLKTHGAVISVAAFFVSNDNHIWRTEQTSHA